MKAANAKAQYGKILAMTKSDVSQVLERVRSWPEERQEEAANVLLEMEAQDASPYRLTDEQLAEA